jgi:hypothetical protein
MLNSENQKDILLNKIMITFLQLPRCMHADSINQLDLLAKLSTFNIFNFKSRNPAR